MSDDDLAASVAALTTAVAEVGALSRLSAPADPAPVLPRSLPKPVTDPSVVRPAPTSGLAPSFAEPVFDSEKVAAEIARPPVHAASGHLAGDVREPEEPLAPLAGVEVPADLTGALAEYDRRYQAWQDAVDAVEEWRDEARISRAAREAAIAAAGRAAARGEEWSSDFPEAVSEADEDAKARVLSTVVEVRRREATAAARKADRLSAGYAATWAETAVGGFGPALAEANATAQAAREAALRAESVLTVSAHWRAVALVAELEAQGVRVSEHRRARIASDLLDGMKTSHYATAEAQRRSPSALASEVQQALGTLSACDPGAVPHAESLSVPGGESVAWPMWRKIFDSATPARKQRLRDRHRGGTPFGFELPG
ncbi:hypothetical protein [Micromonospora sp. NPDC003241]